MLSEEKTPSIKLENIQHIRHCNSVVKSPEELSILTESIRREREARGYISRMRYPYLKLCAIIESEIIQHFGPSAAPVKFTEVPSGVHGDLSLSLPSLIKVNFRKYEEEIVPLIINILSSIKDVGIDNCYSKGIYINILTDTSFLTPAILQSVSELGPLYGHTDLHRGKNVYVDYSSPNIGKSLHVGHAGSTLIGDVQSNILDAVGYSVYRVNYIGDWGNAAAKLIYAIKEYGDAPANLTPLAALSFYADIYTRISNHSKENENIALDILSEVSKLNSGDIESLMILDQIRTRSIDGLNEIYNKIGVSFDAYVGESFYEQFIEATLKDALDKNIACQEEDGTIIVDLKSKNLPSFVLRRPDGTSTYSLRDIAALRVRNELTRSNLSLYFVGSEQVLHLAQVLETATRLEYITQDQAHHTVIGLLTKNGKKISSREGNALSLENLWTSLSQEAYSVMDSRNPDMPNIDKDHISAILANGAIYFTFCERSPEKGFEFNFSKIFALEGKSALFLQYAAVRAASILKNVKEAEIEINEIDWDHVAMNLPKTAIALIAEIAKLPLALESAASLHAPYRISEAGLQLAHLFNRFAQEVNVKYSEGELGQVYRHLLKATHQCLLNVLSLMNIEVPKKL